jgi:hypothetical protein
VRLPILFDDFKPGERLGETDLVYTTEFARQWDGIFGAPENESERAARDAGIATAIMMRGYLSVVAPRPPGNVHARQNIVLSETPVQEERIRIAVSCVAKQMRRDRRYVELHVDGSGNGGRPICSGRMTLIWAC